MTITVLIEWMLFSLTVGGYLLLVMIHRHVHHKHSSSIPQDDFEQQQNEQLQDETIRYQTLSRLICDLLGWNVSRRKKL